MNKQQVAWLKDGIEYLEHIHRWGPPGGQDALDVALTCEEYVQEGNILAHRVGAGHLASEEESSPGAALSLLSRLETWARERVPDAATLRVAEAARLLRVNRDKVLGWIHAGRLPATNTAKQPGGRPRYRIARADLDGFLATRTNRQPAAKQKRRQRTATAYTRYFPEA